MHKIEAHLLGGAHILVDGQTVELPFKQADAFLYYLLAEGPVLRTRLADLIWGDKGDERKIQASVRNAIYVLRKNLGTDLLQEPRRGVLTLNPEYQIDLDFAFLEQDEIPLPDSWPGSFLDGFYLKGNESYNNWVFNTRQRYDTLYIERLRREIEQSYSAQHWGLCETYCHQLLEVDEYDESTYCCLIDVYRILGEYSKATSLYEQMQKLFAKELFQQPGEKATLLIERIKDMRNQQVSQLMTQKFLTVGDRGKFFFGRTQERSFLTDEVQLFLSGRTASSMAVQGEIGIGKTCLIERVLRDLDSQTEILSFRTRCYHAEENYALKPWQNIFDGMLRHFQTFLPEAEIAPFTAAISDIFPIFSKRPAAFALDQDEIAASQHHQEQSVAHAMIKLTQKQRVVLFFDDLQYADQVTIALIRYVLTLDQNRSIQFLFTCKDDRGQSVESLLEDMSVAGLLKKVTLERFSYDETVAMAQKLLPDHVISSSMWQNFYRETDGSPFFILETASSIRDQGSMSDITPNIRDSICARMMSLPAECRSILGLLSIFFDGATFDTLLELSGWEEYELAETLETLLERRIIFESGQLSEVKFQFCHQKILEYNYDVMSATKKRILHHKTALYLEGKLTGGDQDISLYPNLMYHFQRSGDRKKYLQYYVGYVYLYLNRSHEYYPITPKVSSSAQDTLGIEHGGAERVMETLRDISGLIKECLSSLDDADRTGFLSDYYHMMGRYYIRKVDYENGLPYIQKLLDINRGCSSPRCCTNTVKALRQLMCVVFDRYETEKMKPILDEAFGLIQHIYSAEEDAIWMRLSGLCSIMSGQVQKGIELLTRAIDIFEHSEERELYLYNLAACYAWLGEAQRHQMRYGQAMSYYEKAIAICQSHYLTGGIATFYTYAGQAAFDSGDLRTAEEYLSLAIHQFDQVDLMWGRGIACGYYGLLCLRRGRFQEACDHLMQAQRFAVKLDSCYELGVLQRIFAQIALEMEHDPQLRGVFGSFLDQHPRVYAAQARHMLETVYSPVDQMYLEQIESTLS